jgi:hypothetical protein
MYVGSCNVKNQRRERKNGCINVSWWCRYLRCAYHSGQASREHHLPILALATYIPTASGEAWTETQEGANSIETQNMHENTPNHSIGQLDGSIKMRQIFCSHKKKRCISLLLQKKRTFL